MVQSCWPSVQFRRVNIAQFGTLWDESISAFTIFLTDFTDLLLFRIARSSFFADAQDAVKALLHHLEGPYSHKFIHVLDVETLKLNDSIPVTRECSTSANIIPILSHPAPPYDALKQHTASRLETEE